MGTETITNTQAPWGPQQAPLKYGWEQARNLYNTGGPQYYPSSTVTPFGSTTTAALSQYAQLAGAGNPISGPAQNMLAGTLQGDYLSPQSNPYLQAMSDAANRQTTRQYSQAVAPGIGAQFDSAGRYGSDLYQNQMDQSRDTLARSLGETNAQLYGQAYENERVRQMQGLDMAPQTAQLGYFDASQLLNVGELRDAKAQQELADEVQRYQFGQERPYDALSRFMGTVGGGNYGVEKSEEYFKPSGLSRGLGIGLSALGVLSGVKKAGGIRDIFKGVW